MTEEKKQRLEESGLVEWSVFSEIIAMDEDEEGFSHGLVVTFVQQVVETFDEIEQNLKSKDLDKLSALGHYLKGSAAALGLVKISSQCERIQNYGHRDNFDDFKIDSDLSESDTEFWLLLIEDAFQKAKSGFEKSKEALNDYFDDEL